MLRCIQQDAGTEMVKAISLTIALIALWLTLSGHFTPFLLAMGLASVLFTVYLAARMRLLDDEAVPVQLRPALVLYWVWLAVEIFKASVAVCRVILAREMKLSQQLIRVPWNQSTEMGRTIFANSITLTPGTITVETGKDAFLVHALTEDFTGADGFEEMGGKVTEVEVRHR
ncbi:Na+/H+ antiporter subunit E [Parvibaculum sp.]|jgi:multicomponent Na+:H+ antiporter subunit E|uniref:Na+/H+ antiporter subunit E n=1 Tax=Parvibaculum sp. TaxID=2024848 RepID=UPI0025FC1C39|nr:Na+/H+ antiporter subunit E [Parvibaculum sp.]